MAVVFIGVVVVGVVVCGDTSLPFRIGLAGDRGRALGGGVSVTGDMECERSMLSLVLINDRICWPTIVCMPK